MAPPDGAAASHASEPRDFHSELEALEERLSEAERYLGLDKLEARRAELEAEAARPDLWDDADNARAVTKELGRVSADLDQLVGLRGLLDDARALLELTEESAADGSPRRLARDRAGRDGRPLGRAARLHWSCSRCSRASTTSSTRCARCMPGRAGPTPRTGPK